MWPLKRRVDYREFCGEFYNNEIFSPRVREKNRGEIYWDGALREIETSDPSFASVDKDIFQREFRAIYCELFSLAWTHRLKKRTYILPQVIYTKGYMDMMEHGDVWDAMSEYNRAVGDSADPSLHQSRQDLAADLADKGMDPQSAERAANRLATDDGWKSGVISELMASSFLQRVGRNPNSGGSESVHGLTKGLYKRAEATIKGAKISMGT